MLTYGSLVLQVVQNMSVLGIMAFLLTRLPVVYNAWTHAHNDLPHKIILGVLFGLLSASGNWLSVAGNYGFLTNARQISAEVGGLLGGPLVGLLAGILGAVPRLFWGGFTLWPAAMANVIVGVISGLIAKRLGSQKINLRLAALAGFLGECILTVLVLTMSKPFAVAWQLEKTIAIPAILLNTLAVVVFVYIVHDVFSQREVIQALSVHRAKIEEQRLLLLQTEYRMLRAQVNPHFFFNTLSTIQALITSEPEKSVVLIKDLANFFRKALNRDQEVVTVKEELETVHIYIQIEKVRFGERIKVVETLPTELLAYQIPIFFLQILVENAIRHGLSLKKGNGTVRISGWWDSGGWYLNVEDDGVGISEERLEEIRKGEPVRSARGTGIGLSNIRHRIQTLYGDDCGLKIQSQVNKGTSVTLRFPRGRHGEGEDREKA